MALAIFFTSLVQKLSWLFPEASSSSMESQSSAEESLQDLKDAMEKIHAELEGAEEEDTGDKSEQLRLSELKDVAYDADDALDEYEYEVLRAKVEARRRAMACRMLDSGEHTDEVIFDWNSYTPQVSISDEWASKVKEIRKRFENITSDWDPIISLRDQKRKCIRKWKPTETSSSWLDKHQTFGREEEKEKIIEWLLQGGNGCSVSVLPIVGMGGLGKTTLAQMVYNDSRVCQHFDFRGWIYVSEDFVVERLMKRIHTSFDLAADSSVSLDMTFEALKRKLNGKEFFLVLDDVWYQSFDLWNSLKTLLGSAGVGKILMTTRNENVAEIMQTTSPIKLRILPYDNCWSLFSAIAFEARAQDFPAILVDIGERIVDKCAGLPLAVKMIASFLRSEDDEETWLDTLRSELWELDNEQYVILPALRLSYDHMPTELKPCFMYLSLFPKDYPLHRLTIIQQWMAQGFLQSSEEKQEKDIGSDCLNELLHRSFLQYGEYDDEFEMHELIHDLARDVARAEYLLISVDKLHQMIPRTIRHLSLVVKESYELEELKLLFESKLCLRTLLLHSFRGFSISNFMSNLMHNLASLRTLRLELRHPQAYAKPPMNDVMNLDFVGSLKHLRYLGVSPATNININVSQLVYKLYHLQTLDLDLQAIDLPISDGIGDLVNLRHFFARSRTGVPQEVVGLTNLETIREFVVGDGAWQCKLRHLKDLVNLQERLKIRGLNHVDPCDFTASDAFMKARTGIVDLELCWHRVDDNGDDNVVCDERLAEEVLDYLRPHPKILGLGIDRYPSAFLPMWLGSFSKLVALTLNDCSRITSLPTLGHLPGLRCLQLRRLNRVKIVGAEFLYTRGATRSCCFPSLEKLEFKEMGEWEEWDGVGDADFPRLRELQFITCPKLRRLPSLSSLDGLTISACPELRLSSLASLTKFDLGNEWNLDVLSCGYSPMLQLLIISHYPGDSLVFPDHQSLHSLQELAIGWCSKLRSVAGLGNFSCLQHLTIAECQNLQISPNEPLPPNVKLVRILESPGAEQWYQLHQTSQGSSSHQVN